MSSLRWDESSARPPERASSAVDERRQAESTSAAGTGAPRPYHAAMNRLPLELDRLYGADRAAVLSLSLPAGWAQLSMVWRGVQADLELPAPAIAVSGADALQLWFAFASPPSASDRAHLLEGLRARYLVDAGSAQVRLFGEPAGMPAAPGIEVAPQRWSAFITHDLASVFADTPWLDIPPSDEGQAALLRALEPIQAAALAFALGRLEAPADAAPSAAVRTADQRDADPAHFLARVMNDEAAPLALRIEAARILLLEGQTRR